MRKRAYVLLFALPLAALMCLVPASGVRAEENPEPGPANRSGTSNGFQLASTDKGTVTMKLLSYVRYLNQDRLDATYTDTFGNTSPVKRRQDIHLNKVNIQFMGWARSPKLRYLAYVWTSGTSQGQTSQVVVGGNLNYSVNKYVTLGGGIGALPGVRSTEGTFPFWLSMDNRLIADEFFRPSYTMGVWASGEVTPKLEYHAMLGNNLSQFGVDAGQIDNGLNTVAVALKWYPTTGEFGALSGFGDFEQHDKVATRLGAHYTRSLETSQSQPSSDGFENVQIRLSDGSVIFKPGLFGDGIQVREATYQMTSADAAVKYRGVALEGEYYWRRIDNLDGPGVAGLPFTSFIDDGFQLQASVMAIPKTIMAYAGASKVFGERGDPYDGRLGVTWYPYQDRVVWWNFEYLYTKRSPVGGASLPYVVGGNGDTFYTNFVLNF